MSATHQLGWAEQRSATEFVVECACGATWTRERFPDAATALEVHVRQADGLVLVYTAGRADLLEAS